MIESDKIKEIVDKIIKAVDPEKIILFGSYANGTANKHSDLDLCVVVDEKSDRNFVYEKLADTLWEFLIPVDIIIYSQTDFYEWQNVKMAFPTIIMRTGKILYEKQK